MEDKGRKTVLSDDWENGIFREAIEALGDPEALKLFDEEQAALKKRAEAEIKEMRKKGIIKEA